MRQQSGTVPRMIRPTWSGTADQKKKLAAAIAAARKADQAEDEAWRLIREARDAGVPDTVLCDQTDRSRATLNRRFGKRTEPPSGV